MLKALAYSLFNHLAVGGLVAILVVPPEAGKRFFRFCGITILVLLVLGLWAGSHPWAGHAQNAGPASRRHAFLLLILTACLVIGYVLAVVGERIRYQKPLLSLAALVGTVGLLMGGYNGVPASWPGWSALLAAVSVLVSALFLGSTVFAMILGHWYLVVPTLPLAPLRSLTRLMAFSALVKALLVALILSVFWVANLPQTQLLSFWGLGGIFLWARLLFGLLGPLVLCYMTWETVKIHSTQSATGLLYVATFFVLLGESLSAYLFYTTSIPV